MGIGTFNSRPRAVASDTSLCARRRAKSGGSYTLGRKWLAKSDTRPALPHERTAAPRALLEGWIAAREARWKDVVATLAPTARSALRVEWWTGYPNKVSALLLVADAFSHLNQPDSSLAYLQRIDELRGDQMARALVLPYVRHRLVLQSIRAGHVADARKQWELFRHEADKPDPEIDDLKRQAETALADAEAVRR